MVAFGFGVDNWFVFWVGFGVGPGVGFNLLPVGC